MSMLRNTKQHQLGKGSKQGRGQVAADSRRGHGLRVGILDDWRAGSSKISADLAERGKRLRDGR
jgi:hypothetical protein